MSLTKGITFIKGEGGLGRPLSGEDFISGLLTFTANGFLPSGFSSSARIKKLFSPADAETLGIKKDYSDATAAVAVYLITTAGSTGEVITVKVTEVPTYDQNGILQTNVTTLCAYTKVAGDSSIALLGASLAAAINAGTYTHGYTASFTTATLTLTMPKKLGIFPNSGAPLAVTTSGGGTHAGTITQPTGSGGTTLGVASKQAVWRYHIDEFFRRQPKGVLYVGFYAIPTTYNFVELTLMQNFASGKIRQFGVFLNSEAHAYTSADLTAIHTEIVTNCDTNYKPTSALYAADLSATSDLSALTDLNTLSANKASAIIGQDGAALGYYLYKTVGKSITTLGASLGAVSFSSVSDSIEWVGKFNMSNGTELDMPAFANGDLVRDKSQAYLTAIDNNRYIYLMKYVGNAGTYHNDSHTAIVISSDYAYIEGNRTIDKAIRGIYASLLSPLGSPLVLNADGTLTDTTIAYFTSQAETNLFQMKRDAELSAFGVTIDSAQNVLTTNEIVLAVELLPIGVARAIQVNIGFVVKLSTQ